MEEWIDGVYPRIHAFVVSRLGWQVGEDVVQEAMLGIFKGLGKIRGSSEGEFRAYCYRVEANKVNDALRSKYVGRVQPLDPEVLAETIAAGSEGGLSASDRRDLEDLLILLRQAKFPCDEVLRYVLLPGLEIADVAAVYDVSYDAARMKISRCLRAAEALAEEGT